jgi:hypothetical protein
MVKLDNVIVIVTCREIARDEELTLCYTLFYWARQLWPALWQQDQFRRHLLIAHTRLGYDKIVGL